MQTQGRPESSVDKGSSIVAGIIDLRTVSGANEVAFAAIDRAVSGATSGPWHLSENEIANQPSELLRHLIRERHHAS